jgi:hypothetical protein
MAAKPSPATYEDLLKLPPHQVGEILFGVLHAHPRPATPHARTSTALGWALFGPFDRGRGGPGGSVILDEPELHLGSDVVVPDLAGWKRTQDLLDFGRRVQDAVEDDRRVMGATALQSRDRLAVTVDGEA